MYQKKKTYSSELYHHGILGQKWGIRRFQNKDGTLTAAGKERYGISDKKYHNALKKLHDTTSKKNVEESFFREVGVNRKEAKQASQQIRNEFHELINKHNEIIDETNKLFDEIENVSSTQREDLAAVAEVASRLQGKNRVFEKYKHEYSEDQIKNKVYDKLSASDVAKYMSYVQRGPAGGTINEYSIYADEHDLNNKLDSLQKEAKAARKQREDAVIKIADETVKKIGDERVSDIVNLRIFRGMSDYVRWQMGRNSGKNNISDYEDYQYWDNALDVPEREHRTGITTLDSAKGSLEFTDKDREYIQRAKKIMETYNSGVGPHTPVAHNNWQYYNKAVKELGLDSKDAETLTAQDWNRINKKAEQLRKQQ